MNPETLNIVLDAVGGEVPIPAPFLKIRQEPEDDFLIISLPREENNELMIRTLNRVSATIYLLCNGERTIREIVEAMVSFFSRENRYRIIKDVIRAIRDMQHDGLLKKCGNREV